MSRRKVLDLGSQQFYKFEKWILAEDKLKKLSPIAKLLYMVIRDREEISLKNHKDFTDKEGCLYQYFDQVKASELLGVSLSPIKKAFKDLQEYGLIESARQGQGKPNRIYVLNYEVTENTLDELSYDNKKATVVPPTEAKENTKSNVSNNNICNTKKNYTPCTEENILEKSNNEDSEVVNLLKSEGFKNINKKVANETFTDIDKLKKCIDKIPSNIRAFAYLRTTYTNYVEEAKSSKNEQPVKYHNSFEKKTKFHNFNENFTQYNEDEFEDIIKNGQIFKYGTHEAKQQLAFNLLVKDNGKEIVSNWSDEEIEKRINTKILIMSRNS